MKLNNPQVKTASNGIGYVPARLVEGAGDWYILYYIFDEGQDKLIRKRFYKIKGSTAAEKRKDARGHIVKINKALSSGLYIKAEETREEAQSVSIKQGFEYVIELKSSQLGKRSSSHYRLTLGEFLKYLEAKKMLHYPAHMIRRADVVLFLDTIQKERKLANKTRNNYRTYIYSAFNILLEREWIEANPVLKIPTLKETRKEYRSFTNADHRRINDYMKRNHHRLWEFTQFIFYGFIRPVEITRLKIEHIRLDKRVVLISPTDAKNGEFKPVEITKSLREVIENMELDKYPSHYYVFSAEKGWLPGEKQLVRNRVSEAHKIVLQNLGLDNGIYDMYSHKHTGNERAVLAGMDIYWVMSQNRHSSLEQTQIYLRGLGLNRKGAQEKDW